MLISNDHSGYSSDDEGPGDNGDVLTVNLGSSSALQSRFLSKRTTTSRFQITPEIHQEDLAIVAASFHDVRDGKGSSLQVVTRKKQLSQRHNIENLGHWLHLRTPNITLERFEQFVRGITIKYHEELVPVVLSLFDSLRSKYEERSGSGSYIQPGTVLRCDGIDRSDTEKPDSSVLFTCFPYFDVGSGKPHGPPKDRESTLLSRGLFQSAYPEEPTQDRDVDQVFQHMKQVRHKEYLSVDQLWSVVLASSTVVTCGPSSLSGLFEGGIDFVDEEKLRSHGRSLIHVTDPFGGVTYLPLHQCRTWLEARQTMEEKCFTSSYLTLDDCNMHYGKDGEILDAAQWPNLLKSEGFIYIHLKQKVDEARKAEEAKKAGEAKQKLQHASETRSRSRSRSIPLLSKRKPPAPKTADQRLLVEYAELSSDEEEPVENKAARFGRFKPRNHRSKIRHESYGDKQDTESRSEDSESVWDRTGASTVHLPGSSSDPNFEVIREDHIPGRPSDKSLPDGVDRLSPRKSGLLQSYEATHSQIKPIIDPIYLETRSTRASSPASTVSTHAELYSDDIVRNLQDDQVASEASRSNVNNLKNGSELDYVDDDRDNVSVLAPGKEKNLPDNIISDVENLATISKPREEYNRPEMNNSDLEEVGTKANSTEDMIEDHVSNTLEVDGSKQNQKSESQHNWDSSFLENTKEPREGTWEGRSAGHAKDTSKITGLATDMATLPSVEAQLADLKDLIGSEIQPSLRTNHALIEEIHAFISSVDITQTLAEVEKRKDFIRQEITMAIQMRKAEEQRVIQEYSHKKAREEMEQEEVRDRIVMEYERKKALDAAIAKLEREKLIEELRIEEAVRKQKEQEEYRNFLKKQREMEEEAKAKQEKAKEELEEAMRTRLARVGFPPDQIEAIVSTSEEKPPDPRATQQTHQSNHQSAFTKVHKANLDVETLRSYNIPYEWDADDPGYIIILQDLSVTDTDILFEHTRRLRKPRRAIEFVSDQNAMTVKIDPELRVPPFLTWPTRFDDDHDQVDAQPSQDNAAFIELTLFAIEKQVAKKKLFVPDGPLRPIVIDRELRADFSKLPEKSLEDLDSGVASTSWNLHLQSRAFQNLAHETAFLMKAHQEAGMNSSKQNPHLESPETLTQSPQVVSRRVLQWQLAHLCHETEAYVDTAQKLIDQFVPKHYAHPLLRRCWWSLEVIQRMVAAMCTIADEREKSKPRSEPSDRFILRVVPYPAYTAAYQLEALPVEMSGCNYCQRPTRYTNFEHAIRHLQKFHVAGLMDASTFQSSQLNHYVVSLELESLERTGHAMLQLLKASHDRCKKLLSKAVEIRSSVANEENKRSSTYLLTPSLVKTAEKVFELIYATTLVMCSVREDLATDVELWTFPSAPLEHIASLDHPTRAASTAMFKASDALLLMAHTRSSHNSVVYTPSTLEGTVLYCIEFLTNRNILGHHSLVELYRNYHSKLRYEAGHRPSKRNLRELYLLDEEIELIAATYKLQLRTHARLQKVLNDASYRKPSQQRIRSFRTLECNILGFQILTRLPMVLRDIRNLQRRLNKTAQVLRHNIEIAEEGNSKAIMVFTIVTIIFLPLSFVAAVFGMNTADIRDMNSDQDQFWKIAIPTTATIGALSLLVAFGGPPVRAKFDKANRLWSELRDSPAVIRLKRLSLRRQGVTDEENTDDAHSTSSKEISQSTRRATAHPPLQHIDRVKTATTSPERRWLYMYHEPCVEKAPTRIATPPLSKKMKPSGAGLRNRQNK